MTNKTNNNQVKEEKRKSANKAITETLEKVEKLCFDEHNNFTSTDIERIYDSIQIIKNEMLKDE